MTKSTLRWQAALVAGLILFTANSAWADVGAPRPWQMWYQPAASPMAERAFDLHHYVLYVITAIVIFVLGLLLIVIVKFNAKANPTPRQFAHNTVLEFAWTVIPAVILIFIAIPSWRLIYYQDRTAQPEMTLKVTGYQWYWGYEYPDQGGISFMSNYIHDNDIDKSKGQLRLLSTDNAVVVPVDTNIQVLVTASDVIHSWSVPAFGVKIDAVPGRTNETWMRITKTGTYYGQCDQLCGQNHSFMPIEIRAVSKEAFQAWVKDPKHVPPPPDKMAMADTAPSGNEPAAEKPAGDEEPASEEPAKEEGQE
ncbi:MAG TPA: cytochrome c oxidase subunit II [Patescibacteria group bacterium]|nr:cytochrome c oxidase subunit II [Patescibacteria group bacterium]